MGCDIHVLCQSLNEETLEWNDIAVNYKKLDGSYRLYEFLSGVRSWYYRESDPRFRPLFEMNSKFSLSLRGLPDHMQFIGGEWLGENFVATTLTTSEHAFAARNKLWLGDHNITWAMLDEIILHHKKMKRYVKDDLDGFIEEIKRIRKVYGEYTIMIFGYDN